MSNKSWLDSWREQRRLKGLGALAPEDIKRAERYASRRHEADPMPEQWQRDGQWAVSFAVWLRLLTNRHAASWITAHKELPAVRGRLRGGVK